MDLMQHWRGRFAVLGAIATAALAFGGTPAFAQPTPAAGQLRCDVEGGVSFIVGSSRRLNCVYTPAGGVPEFYRGSINKLGIDVGFQSRGVIVWGVISPGLTRGPGALSGNYIGLSADASAGLGVGANALMGGNKVVLQPISVSGNVGINLAAGIGDITLTYVGGPAPVIREYVPFNPQ